MEVLNEDLITKLKFLNLDIENIPECLLEYNILNYNVSRMANDKDHRVFRHVPIDKIEILLTPCLREDSLKDKYSKAIPLNQFLKKEEECSEEDFERFGLFLNAIRSTSIDEIKAVEETQKKYDIMEPFKVKYPRDSMWQIYYSEDTDRYFMLVCTKEGTQAEFLYLLKRKIEYFNARNSDGGDANDLFDQEKDIKMNMKKKGIPCIYVPINSYPYSEKFLNRSEIKDIENYLWLFTQNWCMVFEVYNKRDEFSLQVVGETYIYDNLKSNYRIILDNEQDAVKFYKFVKALFIMQTETTRHFKFYTKLDSKNSLEFYIGKTILNYDSLTEFVKKESLIAIEEIKAQNEHIEVQKEELQKIKDMVSEREEEYLQKQREISTYLECRKTFVGKVKYFFKSSKKTAKRESNSKPAERSKTSTIKLNESSSNVFSSDKEFYSIEDLILIYSNLEKCEKDDHNIEKDIKAQKLKLENLDLKVKNANLYINEIDKHKRSIFDFWKFANKDEKQSLEVGNMESEAYEKPKYKKSFNFETDFEELGKNIDLLQRKKLSNEEFDSLFISQTELIYILNMLREQDMNKDALEIALNTLKAEYECIDPIVPSTEYDVLAGTALNDSRTIKYIGNRSHRENEKDKYKILNINKKIDIFDFIEKMQLTLNYLESANHKIPCPYDMSFYKIAPLTEKIKDKAFDIYDVSIESALKNYDNYNENVYNLIKINFKEGYLANFYTNSVFYDNKNKTLPEGMDISSKCLIDCTKFTFNLVATNRFKINNYFKDTNNEFSPKHKDIYVYEYDAQLKEKDEKEKAL